MKVYLLCDLLHYENYTVEKAFYTFEEAKKGLTLKDDTGSMILYENDRKLPFGILEMEVE